VTFGQNEPVVGSILGVTNVVPEKVKNVSRTGRQQGRLCQLKPGLERTRKNTSCWNLGIFLNLAKIIFKH
jgi:hypothetical protein